MIYLQKQVETIQGVVADCWTVDGVSFRSTEVFDVNGNLDVNETIIKASGVLRLWKDVSVYKANGNNKGASLDFAKFHLEVPVGDEMTPDEPMSGFGYIIGSLYSRIVNYTKTIQEEDEGGVMVDVEVPVEFRLSTSGTLVDFNDAAIVSA